MVTLRNSRNHRRPAFEIRTYLVGSQFYEGGLPPGEPLEVKQALKETRSASKRASERAICVADRRGKTLGYLPGHLTKWLAPLMDDRRVRVTACVAEKSRVDHRTRLALQIITLRIRPPSLGERVAAVPPRGPLAKSPRRAMLVSLLSHRKG